MELAEIREEIRKCDEKIIELVERRTKLAEQIAEVKIESGLPIRNPDAEEKVKTRYREIGKTKNLSEKTMDRISEAVIEEAVAAEYRVKDEKE